MANNIKKYPNGIKTLFIVCIIFLVLILLIIIYIRIILPKMLVKDIFSEKKSLISFAMKKQLEKEIVTINNLLQENNISTDTAIAIISSIKTSKIQLILNKLMNDKFSSITEIIDELFANSSVLKSEITAIKNDISNKYTLNDIKKSISELTSDEFRRIEVVLFWPSIKKILIEMIKK